MSENSTNSSRKATALVMAASRRGADDIVAQMQNKSHKCLVEIDGVVMLERVVEALIDAGCFDRIYVSIENEGILRTVPQLGAWLDEGRIAAVESTGNLADSVYSAASEIPSAFPLVITTGDNALHTPELVRDFMDQFWNSEGDVAIAFTQKDIVLADYPDVGLAFHNLKDGGYSACNLYGLRNERALGAVGVFKGGGQFGKKPIRILKAFGILPFVLYKLKAVGLQGLMHRIARNLGVSIDPVLSPYSFGPIDVDNPQFFAISEEALKKRRLEDL